MKLSSRYLGDNRVADIKAGEYSYIEIEKGTGKPSAQSMQCRRQRVKEGKTAAQVIGESLEIIDEMTKAGKELDDTLGHVYESADNVRGHELKMQDTMKTQLSASEEISETVGRIKDESSKTFEDSNLCMEQTQLLSQKLGNLDEVVTAIRDSSYRMISGVQVISRGVHEMDDAAALNEENAKSLRGEMEQFRV